MTVYHEAYTTLKDTHQCVIHSIASGTLRNSSCWIPAAEIPAMLSGVECLHTLRSRRQYAVEGDR